LPDLVGTTLGNYRIVERLGAGGMGAVYAGEHVTIGRRAAIKVLHAEHAASPSLVQRFFNEARATNLVKHPGIVDIYDTGTAPDAGAYLVMELLEGESLARRLGRDKTMAPPEVASLVRQVASAVGAAHGRGIVHRDLKPENLFLLQGGGGLHVKVLDFGIAKLRDGAAGAGASAGAGATSAGLVMGTPRYMSPEQCHGAKDVDHRADIYALGIIAYEALCGRPPFVADGAGPTISMHLADPPPKLSDLNPTLPRRLELAVMKALEKEPARRYESMAEMAQAIDEAVEALAAATLPGVPGRPAAAGPRPAAEVAAHARTVAEAGAARDADARRSAATHPGPAGSGDRDGAPRAGPSPAPAVEPVEPSAPPEAPPVAARRAPRRTVWAFVAIALAAGGGSLAVWRFVVRPDAGRGPATAAATPAPESAPATAATAAPPLPAVAFLPFDDDTASEPLAFLAGGLPRALAERFAALPGATVVSYDDLRDVVGPGTVAREDWLAAARGRGAVYVVDGRVAAAGGGAVAVTARLRLFGPRGSESDAGEAVETDDPAQLADVVTRLAAALVPRAWPRALAGGGAAGTSLPAASKRALTALRAYHLGVDAEDRRDWAEAVKRLEEAVAREPSFGEAWLQLALAGRWRRAVTAPEVVLERAAALAPAWREQTLVEALRLLRDARAADAVALLEPLRDQRPHDRDVLYTLGEAYGDAGRPAAALAAFRAAVAVAPAFLPAAGPPLRAALAARDEETARPLLALYRRFGEPAAAEAGELELLFALRRYDDAETAAAAVGAGAAETAARVRAAVALVRGDDAAARALVDRDDDALGTAAGWSAPTALVALALRTGDGAAAHRGAERLARWAAGPGAAAPADALLQRVTLGLVRALARDAGGAEEDLAAVDAERDRLPGEVRRAAALLRAQIGWVEGKNDLLADALAAPDRDLRLFAEGLRAERAGDAARAAALLRAALEEPGDGAYALVIRNALARNLRAGGDAAGAAVVCDEIRRPAVYHPFREPAVADCDHWAGTP
jgi:serine/threonine-protein kinase